MKSIKPGEQVTSIDIEKSILERRAQEKKIEDKKSEKVKSLDKSSDTSQASQEVPDNNSRASEINIGQAIADLLLLKVLVDMMPLKRATERRSGPIPASKEIIDAIVEPEEPPRSKPQLPSTSSLVQNEAGDVGKRTNGAAVDPKLAGRLGRRDENGKRQF